MADLNEDNPTRASLLTAYFDGKFSIDELGKLTDKQAQAVDRLIDKAISLIHLEIDENTSDGYHTFKELYQYRMLYNAAFFNMANFTESSGLTAGWNAHKSLRHSDGELCFGGGWFIVIAYLPLVGQISNHYEIKDWDNFDIPEKEKADEWDGHTPAEAAERLTKWVGKGEK